MRTATATPTGETAASTPRCPRRPRRRSHVVRRYRDGDGATRELIARPAPEGAVLLIDRDLLSGGDQRLVARLSAEEPSRNALIAARLFLDAAPRERRCRRLEQDDLRAASIDARQRPVDLPDVLGESPPTVLAPTSAFRLQGVSGEMSIPALRWMRGPRDEPVASTPVSLRECDRGGRELRAAVRADELRAGAPRARPGDLHHRPARGADTRAAQPDRAQPRAARGGRSRRSRGARRA